MYSIRIRGKASTLIVAGLVVAVIATTLLQRVDNRTLAGWIMPDSLRARVIPPQLHVIVSEDGQSVAIERYTGFGAAKLRVIDLVTGSVRDGLPPDWLDQLRSWAERKQARDADGEPVERFTWKSEGAELCLPASSRRQYQVTRAEGVVFETRREVGALVVDIHDVRTGWKGEVARLANRATARASVDGESLLVLDMPSRKARTGNERAVILNARSGVELGMIEACEFAQWIGNGHRFVHVQRAGRHSVVDLERSTEVDLGERDARAYVHAVAGEKLLVVDGDSVTLHEGASGRLLQVL